MGGKIQGPLTEPLFYLLMAYRRREICGTEAATYIAQRTGGRIRMGPGTLYTLLAKCVEQGVLQETMVEGRRRTYQITQKGIDLYQAELERLKQCVADGEAEEALS